GGRREEVTRAEGGCVARAGPPHAPAVVGAHVGNVVRLGAVGQLAVCGVRLRLPVHRDHVGHFVGEAGDDGQDGVKAAEKGAENEDFACTPSRLSAARPSSSSTHHRFHASCSNQDQPHHHHPSSTATTSSS